MSRATVLQEAQLMNMNKIEDYNVVCTNLKNRCHLTYIERTGSIVSVFLGKADFFCAYPRTYRY